MVALIASTALAGKIAPYTVDAIDNVTAAGSGNNLTSVRDDGDTVVITITSVSLSPMGVNTDGKNLAKAETVELYSAIMDAAGIRSPFVVADVANGTATFRIPNTAKRAGVPVVEHLWGRGNGGKMALVHDPKDPWVIYYPKDDGSPDLNTLAIGLVMYPNGRTKSLKELGLGKLDQGQHPELRQNINEF